MEGGHVTRHNLPASCLITPLRDKLQEKLHRVTLALGSSTRNYYFSRAGSEILMKTMERQGSLVMHTKNCS